MSLTHRIAGSVILGLGLAVSTLSAMADPVKFRISSPAVDTDWHAKQLYVFKDKLNELLPGQFDVEIHLNGVMFKQGAEPVAMQRGNLEMAMISAFDIAKQIPEWSIFTAGYLLRDPDHQSKVFAGDVGKEMYKLVEDKMGLHIVQVAYLGTRQLNLRPEKEIKTPADLAGIKLRMPTIDTWQFLGKALGANPLPMNFGEIYTALQTGTIDGQENPLPTDKAAKFYEVTKQIVLTNHMVDSIFLTISKKAWDSYSPEQQKAIEEAIAAAVQYNNENRIKDEEELLEFFKKEGLKVYSPDVEAFRTHVQKQYMDSDYAKQWPKGMLERINAVE